MTTTTPSTTATTATRRAALFTGAALAASAAVAANPPPAPAPGAASSTTTGDVLRALLQAQAASWSKGDLDGFCSVYADDCIFLSPSGRTDGRAAVLERYKKKYVEGRADKGGMGALSLDVLHIAAGDKVASVAMRWKLVFGVGKGAPAAPTSAAPTSAEGFSVVAFELRGAAGWKIVHDASF